MRHLLSIAVVVSALLLPYSAFSLGSSSLEPVKSQGTPSQSADCGCSSLVAGASGPRFGEPAATTVNCPGDCINYDMPAQTRCVGQWAWEDCNRNGHDYKEQSRKRWKWVCGRTTYISCGDYYDDGHCCDAYDPGTSCAGNSGLPVCIGTPVGAE